MMDPGAQSVSLQIPAGEVTLAGDLEIPANAHGLVLFAHGSGSSRRSPRNQAVAEILRDAGLATLLFDLLTPEEEVQDAYTGHLRFDIGMLSGRLAIVTEEIADDEKLLAVVPHATDLLQEPGTLEEVARLAANWFRQHLRSRQ